MLKLMCKTCNNEYLCKNAYETECPKCEWRRTRHENKDLLENFNEAIKELETRLDLLKDDGLIDEEAYQLGLLGISYLQQAAH